jgi:DNA-directed RNA polymerase subunit F
MLSLNSIKEATMIMKNYVADELANKVYHLTKALNQAESIIKVLEEENNSLKQTLSSIYNTERVYDNILIEV